MSLNQMNHELNDAFETYFPVMNPVKRFLFRVLNRGLSTGLQMRRRWFGGTVRVNERIVENPQILRWLGSPCTVLDVGCVTSRLPIQLASLGFTVHGLDGREYPFKHPNFTFHKADLFHWEPDCTFDAVLLVSVIEHFGLGDYGDVTMEDADFTAVDRLKGWIRPGGRLLVSVPFGRAMITPKHRIYDQDRLRKLFNSFETTDEMFFRREGNHWFPCSGEDLRDADSSGMPPTGVAVLDLVKPLGK